MAAATATTNSNSTTSTNSNNIDGLKLTDNVVKTFRNARVFHENTDRINALDFSANGETLITSSDDDSIVIYDCQSGSYVSNRTLFSGYFNVIVLFQSKKNVK